MMLTLQSELRTSNSETSSNDRWLKIQDGRRRADGRPFRSFGFWSFGFVSDFGFRISDFTPTRRQPQRAFTLIELLLVLVILGVLAAIVVPKFAGRTEQARVTAAHTQIATFGTALDAFEVDNGYYPKGKNGLQDLVVQPRDALNWKGPYMKSDIPLDPWGNAYIYECPGKHNPTGYDLMSMGPDARAGSEDDITNWQTAGSRQR
jgi:general secretion pathway protein G